MATLYRQPGSIHWWIRYSKDGKQFRSSTGTADHGKAEIQLREVDLLLRHREETGTVSQKLADAIRAETIHTAAIATVFEERRKHVAPSTAALYKGRDGRFLSWLAEHYPEVTLISEVDRPMIRAFLSGIAGNQQPRTHNGYLRRIRMVFSSAVKDGYALQDPTVEIDFLDEENSPRRPFTDTELEKLFAAAAGETKLLAMMGLYAGAMRLSDIINLKWDSVDLKADVIRWRMRKRRGKHMEIAIHPTLKKEIKAQEPHKSDDLVFPSYLGLKHRASEAFRKVLVAARLKKDTRPDNNRRYKKRKQDQAKSEKEGRQYVPDVMHNRPKDELDFHSLRYNFVSILKKNGCPEAIARSIMGHSSVEVSAIYTHIDDESERKWVTSLPDVVAGNS